MESEKLKFIRHGSAKDIYRADKTSIAFRFTNHFSVFDVGRSEDEIPGKAEAVCACAVKSFQIANEIGVPTHFIEQIDSTTIRVHEAQIITDRYMILADENYVVPAEFIYRLFVAGSIERDFQSGKKNPEYYGLPAGKIPEAGMPFPYPVHMLTTKFEKIDRDISVQQMCNMAGIDLKDQSEYWSMIDRLTGAIGIELSRVGFGLIDGKMECLMGLGRKKMIGDAFGTPDEDRFCPIEKLKNGQIDHYSKEYIRQYYILIGYHKELKAARAVGDPDPLMPRLPEHEIIEISKRYRTFTKNYTGVIINI